MPNRRPGKAGLKSRERFSKMYPGVSRRDFHHAKIMLGLPKILTTAAQREQVRNYLKK